MKSNWTNNKIQYPRLIAEAEAAGAFTEQVIRDMAADMDLNEIEVCEIIGRAQKEWDKIK